MADTNWFVISTPSIGDRAVIQIQSLLERMGYEDSMVWVPTQKATVIKYNKEKIVGKPIFPGYVFIKAKVEDSKLEQALIETKLGKFLHAPGDEDMPTKISETDIERIKLLQDVDNESMVEEPILIQPGNAVEISFGPMVGFKGNVVKIVDREAYVETFVFGRSSSVRINVNHLTKLGSDNEDQTA